MKPGYRVYPSQTTPTNSSVSVPNSDTLLVAANPTRNGLFITNDGAVKVYVSFGTAAATSGNGITLEPNGGMIAIDAASIWAGQVRAISSGANAVVTFTEY